MTTTIKETVLIEDCTVANLIWRKFRRQPAGFLEKVLELNRGLSATALVPVGTEIVFPIDELAASSKKSTDVVRLWD